MPAPSCLAFTRPSPHHNACRPRALLTYDPGDELSVCCHVRYLSMHCCVRQGVLSVPSK